MPKKKTGRKKSLKKKVSPFLKNVSLQTKLLLLVGIVLVFIPTCFYLNENIQLAFFTPHVTAVPKQQLPPPVWISIPKVNIELPIQETALKGSTWEIADHAISHLAVSGQPGGNGPIILYGHNTNDRFGPIRWLHVGDTVTLNTTGNASYSYKITQIVEVDPNQVSFLVNQKGQTLILYTCSGFADLKRFIVIAKPV